MSYEGWVVVTMREDERAREELGRAYFFLSISIARSNFSTASVYRCWSSRSSPLNHRPVSIFQVCGKDSDELIVLRLATLREGFHRSPEGRHRRADLFELVLRDSELDVTEYKVRIQYYRLVVVGFRFLELLEDEVDCMTSW